LVEKKEKKCNMIDALLSFNDRNLLDLTTVIYIYWNDFFGFMFNLSLVKSGSYLMLFSYVPET